MLNTYGPTFCETFCIYLSMHVLQKSIFFYKRIVQSIDIALSTLGKYKYFIFCFQPAVL